MRKAIACLVFGSTLIAGGMMLNHGCSSVGVKNVGYHCWDTFSGKGMEMRGYALYTYVLLAVKTDFSDEKSEPANRYAELLNAVTGLNPYNDSDMIINKGSTNIFYIPGIKSKDNLGKPCFKPASYDFQLSQKYIQLFANTLKTEKKVSAALKANSGPFLVSIPIPLNSYVLSRENRASVQVLFADFSTKHGQTMKDAITQYKNWVEAGHDSGVSIFESLRLSLVSFFANTNDVLVVVQCGINDLKTWLGVI